MERCTECNGSGWNYHTRGGQGGHTVTCHVCNGTGKVKKVKKPKINAKDKHI